MSGREKGVATTPCPNCGTGLNPVQLADGAVSVEACPKCYGAAETASKAVSAPATPSRERGTDTITEEG